MAASGQRASRRPMQPPAEGPANVLAIGKAVPPFVHEISTYADSYFDMTDSNHMVELKEKFKRICSKLQITKRYAVVTKEMIAEYPVLASYKDNSLSTRHGIVMEWVPKLATEAAEMAIKEWGGKKSDITHIVMSSASVVNMPGVDVIVANNLGLDTHKISRVLMYYLGCYAGGAALRIAKDLAENNKGARVLVMCVDCSASFFRAPSEEYLDGLVGHGLFSDGAAAIIVGADPTPAEKPLFEIEGAWTYVIPNTLDGITGSPTEYGLYFNLNRELGNLVANNIQAALKPACEAAGITDLNDVFWALHPGGADIVNKIEKVLSLAPEGVKPTRDILANYGNMSGATVMFVLDQIRKNAKEAGAKNTGDKGGKDLGFFIGIGPGLTIETVVLKSISTTPTLTSS